MAENEILKKLDRIEQRVMAVERRQNRFEDQWSTGFKVLAAIGAIVVGGFAVVTAITNLIR